MKLPKRFLWFEVPVVSAQAQADDHVFRLELIVSSYYVTTDNSFSIQIYHGMVYLQYKGMYSVELNTVCLNTIQRNVKTISCQNTGSKVSGLLPAHARRKFSQISSELAVHLFLCLWS